MTIVIRIREGVTKTRQRGATFFLPFGLAFLADAFARRGEHTAALAAVREGLGVAGATGEHVWDAEPSPRGHGVVGGRQDRSKSGLLRFSAILLIMEMILKAAYEGSEVRGVGHDLAAAL